MSLEMKKRNMIFSDLLRQKISDRLTKKEQVILLLNRRGYSTTISCKACGFTYKCPACDITLTYHKSSNNLRCHYCGYTIFKSDICPNCHEKALTDYGLGTEKLELELNKTFPDAKVIRMDADTTSHKGAHQDIIERFKNHEYDIVIGAMADDQIYNFVSDYIDGVITREQFWVLAKFKYPTHQIAFCTENALKCLEYRDCEVL